MMMMMLTDRQTDRPASRSKSITFLVEVINQLSYILEHNMQYWCLQEVKSDPAMPHRRRRVERHAVSDSNNDIIFELVDDDNDDECLSSSSGDEVQQHQEENPSATKQLV